MELHFSSEVNMPKHLMPAVWVAAFAFSALAQDSIETSSSGRVFSGSAHFGSAPPVNSPVMGAPYSGEIVTGTVQTLADGTHITHTMLPTKVYRDSYGRTRTERSLFRGAVERAHKAPDAPVIIQIVDPVAQVRFTMDTQTKIAHRQPLTPAVRRRPTLRPAASARRTPAQAAPDEIHPETTTEKLEPQTIEGILAEGIRRSTTWPEGSQGNDRPITIIEETWRSPELKVSMLVKNNDPRSGEHTEKLINVSRAEPDASLFQPPADYTIVDEKEEFTIKWGSGPQ